MVFHLAADTRSRGMGADYSVIKSTLAINLVATIGLLEKLNDGDWPVRSFVRTGGLEEYGSGPFPSIESQRELPVSPYSASQVAATHYCVMLQRYLRFPAVTIRPALIYGPAQSAQFFIPSLIQHCLRGRDFEMTSGEQARDLVYVDDAIDALIRASVADSLGGQIINVGSAKEYRLLDVAQAVRTAAGANIGLHVGAAPDRPAEIQHLVCNADKAKALLGWAARTDLQSGLARTIAWYRNHLARAAADHL
jgi:nucleoside-diphosphate-sugar epimerase